MIQEDLELKRSIGLAFGILVVMLNILEIVLILRIKRKKKTYEIALLTLSVADLLFGLSNAVICVIFLANLLETEVLDTSYTTYFFFVTTSIFHLLFIAADRLWAIVSPMKHNIYMTRRKLYIILATIWLTAITITITLYLTNENGYLFDDIRSPVQGPIFNRTSTINNTVYPVGTRPVRRPSQRPSQRPTLTKTLTTRPPLNAETYKSFMQDLLSYIILIANACLVALYAFMIYKVQSSNQRSSKQQQQTQNRVTLVCVFVAASFVLFTTPYAVLRLTGDGWGSFWSNVVLIANSGMNSIIYFFRGRCSAARVEEKRKRKQKQGGGEPFKMTPSATPIPNRHAFNDINDNQNVIVNNNTTL